MSTFRLMLVRHGQTPANVRKALDTRPPGAPLTEEGHEQARTLAESLATEPVVGLYASLATRAQQTATAVAERIGLPLTVLDSIHEVYVGDLEGQTGVAPLTEFHRIYSAWLEGGLDERIPGGETGQEVLDRFLPAIERIRDSHADGVAVLVSHGAAIRLVANELAGNVSADAANSVLLPNTGRIVLELDPAERSGWRCVEWTGIPVGQAA